MRIESPLSLRMTDLVVLLELAGIKSISTSMASNEKSSLDRKCLDIKSKGSPEVVVEDAWVDEVKAHVSELPIAF